MQVITNIGKVMSFLFFLQEGIDTIYLDNTFFFRDFKFQTRQGFFIRLSQRFVCISTTSSRKIRLDQLETER